MIAPPPPTPSPLTPPSSAAGFLYLPRPHQHNVLYSHTWTWCAKIANAKTAIWRQTTCGTCTLPASLSTANTKRVQCLLARADGSVFNSIAYPFKTDQIWWKTYLWNISPCIHLSVKIWAYFSALFNDDVLHIHLCLPFLFGLLRHRTEIEYVLLLLPLREAKISLEPWHTPPKHLEPRVVRVSSDQSVYETSIIYRQHLDFLPVEICCVKSQSFCDAYFTKIIYSIPRTDHQ